MNLDKRISQLEQRSDPNRITAFEIVIVESKEQVNHPERFRKVLQSESTGESGFTNRTYHLERIDE